MNRPIILDNAVFCEGDNTKIFQYNYLTDMNHIVMDNKEIFYIDIDTHLKELETTTRVIRERDDEDEDSINFN